jgi:serine/threonine protein kinase
VKNKSHFKMSKQPVTKDLSEFLEVGPPESTPIHHPSLGYNPFGSPNSFNVPNFSSEPPIRDPFEFPNSVRPTNFVKPRPGQNSFENEPLGGAEIDASTLSKPDDSRVSPATPLTTEGLAPMSKKVAVFKDWSPRGSHVDFHPEEVLPLKEGRILGSGSMGSVYETTIGDHTCAWKRRFCKRNKITKEEKTEIAILKKLSHEHIIQLVGSYTHGRTLGLLLYPVAVCDLATFLEDFESICNERDIESDQKERLHQLGLPYESPQDLRITGSKYMYSKLGCLTSAVEYIHSQGIKHKDLKPANILLSADSIWLTDFGTATDFSLLSSSSNGGCERGTPRYFAPEVAAYDSNGRGADIFSLGCILLELCAIGLHGTLEPLKNLRPAQDKSFHANLNMADDWFSVLASSNCPRLQHLLLEIRRMLAKSSEARPSAAEIRKHMVLLDGFHTVHSVSLFGTCCRGSPTPIYDHKEKLEAAHQRFQQEIQKLQRESELTLRDMKAQIALLEYQNRYLIKSTHPSMTNQYDVCAVGKPTNTCCERLKMRSLGWAAESTRTFIYD